MQHIIALLSTPLSSFLTPTVRHLLHHHMPLFCQSPLQHRYVGLQAPRRRQHVRSARFSSTCHGIRWLNGCGSIWSKSLGLRVCKKRKNNPSNQPIASSLDRECSLILIMIHLGNEMDLDPYHNPGVHSHQPSF